MATYGYGRISTMYTIDPSAGRSQVSRPQSKLSRTMAVNHTMWNDAEAAGLSHRKAEAQARRDAGKRIPQWMDIPLGIVAALVLSFVMITCVGRIYVIPSASMEPTLHGCEGCNGDRVFVEKLSYYARDVRQGDVVVFRGTPEWNIGWTSPRSDNPAVAVIEGVLASVGLGRPDENTIIKRVVATEGQTIQCLEDDPGIMVDGVELDDQDVVLDPVSQPAMTEGEYASAACQGPFFGPVVVPKDHVFVMGDNRTNSLDSRFHSLDPMQGMIPEGNIYGRAAMVVYPFDRVGVVKSVQL